MSFEATISRKKALSAAEAAVEKANELVQRHQETIEEVARIRKGLEALNADATKRLDAQLRMIETVEKSGHDLRTHVIREAKEQRSYVDGELRAAVRHADRLAGELAHRQDRFEQMGFIARVWWVFTGRVPHVSTER